MLCAYRLMSWMNPILKVECVGLRVFGFDVFTV